MAKTITKGNKTVTLLNPSEKGHKFARELKEGVKRTNAGPYKLTPDKKAIRLNEKERAYRSGYLDAQKDNANCYKARNNKNKR